MIKGRIGLLAAVLILMAGCVNKKSVPSDILSMDKMEAVLWDLIQADQYSSMFLVKDSSHTNVKMENLRLYEQVFQLHKVSREEFRKSYKFYEDHPELNQVVLDSVIAMGNRERADLSTRAVFRPTSPSPGIIPPGNLSNPAVPGAHPGMPPVHPGVPGARPGMPGASPALPGSSRFPVPNGVNGRPGIAPRVLPDSIRKKMFHQGQSLFRHDQPPASGKQPVP